ncbi:NAD-binding lipoprotein [Streptomyces sp. NPDC020807]|uniref:CASTOR/POLLUX-related putative ion channel n=1 Tax=Streptomyces sp. NPDC020807 TaxID=3155119 RepID=UPI0033E94080
MPDGPVTPPPPRPRPPYRTGPASTEARLRYWFDTVLTRGTPALVGWLALACLLLVVPVSALLVWTDDHAPASLRSRIAAVWRNTGQTLRLGGEVGPPLRVALSVLLALIALLYVSTLVSLITTGITDKLIALNRGHSTVLERGHTVVLGWSEQIPTVIGELLTARALVTLLADRAKTAMEEELRAALGAIGRTRVICRTGRPADPTALARVSPADAASVLVLPRDRPRDDTETVKALLALTAAAGPDHPVRVVAAVRGDRHLTAARLAGGPLATVLHTDDITARLLVQYARRPGLSHVHQELLDFAGHEFHTLPEPGPEGLTFRKAAARCPESCAAGLVRPDGAVLLNPPADTLLGPGDRLLVVAEDSHSTHPADPPVPYDPTALTPPPPPEPARPERYLLLGWNRRAPRLADQLARGTAPGTTLDVIAPPTASTIAGIRSTNRAVGHRLPILHHPGDPTVPETTGARDLTGYDAVLVLGPDRTRGHAEPDDHTLLTLLHLRERQRGRAHPTPAGAPVPVVAELTDDRNLSLAPRSAATDFVVTGRTIGLLMTQISQNPHLAAVFEELFAADGNSVHLRPAAHYVATGRPVSFATVAESAARRHACAIGYRSHAHGVRLNPPKSHVRHWHPADQIVVIARDDARGDPRDDARDGRPPTAG